MLDTHERELSCRPFLFEFSYTASQEIVFVDLGKSGAAIAETSILSNISLILQRKPAVASS
jgi:hypothetical protein